MRVLNASRTFAGLITLVVVVALMFILFGEPGVDWILIAPFFVLLSRVGLVGLMKTSYQSIRSSSLDR